MSATAERPVYYQVSQAARRFDPPVSVSLLHHWVREGRIEPLRTAGGVLLFTEEEIAELQRLREARRAARAAGRDPQVA